MLLERIYNHAAPGDNWVNRARECGTCGAKGVVINASSTGVDKCPECEGQRVVVTRVPPLDHVKVIHTGTKPNQSFGTRLVDAGIKEGWISLTKGKLVIHSRPDELVYKIDKIPGTYCSHCNMPQDGEGPARAHVKTAHGGGRSPDPESPAGYAKVNAYLCTLETTLHQKYGVKGGGR